MNSFIQKFDVVKPAGLISTVSFTDLGHVRIIVDNSI
jgi:hypothetical protein